MPIAAILVFVVHLRADIANNSPHVAARRPPPDPLATRPIREANDEGGRICKANVLKYR